MEQEDQLKNYAQLRKVHWQNVQAVFNAVDAMLKLLDGKCGFDIKLAMTADLELIHSHNSISPEINDQFQQRHRARICAWRRLLYGAS